VSDVIDDLKNNSTSEAKDFVASRLVEELNVKALPGLSLSIR
jgi:hypothetical protein